MLQSAWPEEEIRVVDRPAWASRQCHGSRTSVLLVLSDSSSALGGIAFHVHSDFFFKLL